MSVVEGYQKTLQELNSSLSPVLLTFLTGGKNEQTSQAVPSLKHHFFQYDSDQ